jgi:tetratricopeptide (TPR) repeat protein
MKLLKDRNSADAALVLRNILFVLPYLALLGVVWGYVEGGIAWAFVGLLAAIAVSAVVGSAATIFARALGGGAANRLYGTGRRTIGDRERLAGDLNVVRFRKRSKKFDEALIRIDDVLAKDPDFPEALFLKAQILWEGFKDHEAAKECLRRIIKLEPDTKADFHRWALDFYREMSEQTKSERDTR